MGLTLDPVQVRVLGCLVEKEATVPDSYPMTRKALTAACNQSSSRDPVTDYDESEVQAALDGLKRDHGLVRFVHPSHGARSTRFRHVAGEILDLDPPALAVLSVLALRGPQTVGEVRTRTERQHAFTSIEEVEAVLEDLAGRSLVVLLGREPGQKEPRWTHLLGDAPPPADAKPMRTAAPAVPAPAAPLDPPAVDLEARLAALEERVALLESLLEP